MKMLRLIARFARARNANVAVMFAFASPLVVGAAGLSVETSYWYFKQHQLQGAADNAAYAAGIENRNGSGPDVIRAAALNIASQNGFNPNLGTITVQTPTSGPYANNASAVNVVLTQPAQRFFTRLFSSSPVLISSNSTSVFNTSTYACILALDPSAAQAAYFSGSSSLTLNGCVVMSDSDASNGVYVWGASSLTASCVDSAGGVQTKNGITDTSCPAPMTNVQPAPDPYRKLPVPATNGPCLTQSGPVLQPGHYCSGLNFQGGNYTLEPGVYVVDGGISANASGTVTGNGVTFYLTDNKGVSMNGNPTLYLNAPTDGPYSGILFFGSRSVSGVTNTFNGTPNSVMTGALYFPTQNVTYQGDFSGQNGCTQIVADTVAWSGNTSFNVNCTDLGVSPIPVMAGVKLVG